jgi:hypothetical protein
MAKVNYEVVVDDAAVASQAGKKSDYASVGELPFVEKTMIAYAARFIIQVQKNLQKANKVDTGTLERDIQEGSLIKDGSSYSIDVGYPVGSKGSQYYDFVNKGVKGFKSGQPNSPYRFRSAYPSMNGPMVNAIQKWVKRNALAQRNETQKYNLSALQTKRKSVSELSKTKGTAYMIARKIKQRGLPKTGFFDNAVDEVFNEQFYNKMAKAVGGDVRVYIKQAASLINEENK